MLLVAVYPMGRPPRYWAVQHEKREGGMLTIEKAGASTDLSSLTHSNHNPDLRFYPHAICTTDAIYRGSSEDDKTTADKQGSEGDEV